MDLITHETAQLSNGNLSLRAFIRMHAARNGHIVASDDVAGTLSARVNHGRWLVDCPMCSGAVVASFIEPVFICPECGSPENGGHWYQVLFPSHHQAIEDILGQRPLSGTRNWTNETVDELQAENRAHL